MKISRQVLKMLMMSLLVVSSLATVGGLWSAHSPNAHAASAFPANYFAPYAELGGASLQSVAQSTGQKYYTLAFMLGNGCTAEWNGTVPLSQASSAFPSLDSDIQYLRGQGGDVVISFGGARGSELAQACTSASSLQAQYQAVVNQYQLSRLDFDIEGGEEGDSTTYDRRNIALAALQQANPGLSISFTLPSSTTGLEGTSIGLLNNALSHNVNFSIVNLMTMDYNSPQSDMGQQSINAANGLYNQLVTLFPAKSSSQLWSMVGITPMIGRNDSIGETFSTSDATKVMTFAQANNIGELAFWAVSRDNGSCPGQTGLPTDNCSGISQSTYAFTNIFQPFTSTGGVPTPTPTPIGNGGAPIGKTIWLQTTNNHNYVSARANQTNAPLNASATQVQAWEEFDVIDAGNGFIALKAHANGNYVSVKIDQTNSPLDAIATQLQGWEKLQWLPQSNGTIALQSQANGDYVSARTDQTNTPLDANVTLIQGWEQFTWGQV